MGLIERLSTVISTKGQVILPKAIRDLRQWAPGTRLIVEDTPEGVLLKAAPLFPATSYDAMFGSMPAPRGALSIEEMDAVLAREAKRRAGD